MAALDVIEARLLLLLSDDDEEEPVDDPGDDEEALGEEEEEDVPEDVLVNRRRWPTRLPLPPPGGGCPETAVLELSLPTATNPPLERFNEYRDPAAASDSRLEHREHVATDAQLRNRFCGLMGSTDCVEFVSASTVSHFRKPIDVCGPSRGTDLGGAKLLQLTSFFSRGTTDHSFWCTELSEVVDIFSRLRVISTKLCSEGLLLILISGDGNKGGTTGILAVCVAAG